MSAILWRRILDKRWGQRFRTLEALQEHGMPAFFHELEELLDNLEQRVSALEKAQSSEKPQDQSQ